MASHMAPPACNSLAVRSAQMGCSRGFCRPPTGHVPRDPGSLTRARSESPGRQRGRLPRRGGGSRSQRERERERDRESTRVCVCVRERERERETGKEKGGGVECPFQSMRKQVTIDDDRMVINQSSQELVRTTCTAGGRIASRGRSIKLILCGAAWTRGGCGYPNDHVPGNRVELRVMSVF